MKNLYKVLGNIFKAIGLGTTVILGIYGSIEAYKTCTTNDFSGEWYLKFVVDSSTYKPYIGESHTQKIYFIQTDKNVIGDGEKWEYNGVLLDFSKHRKLEYQGKVDGNKLKARYILHGRDRVSEGIIDIQVDSDGKEVSGKFSSTAASSKGRVTGFKINN